MCEAMSCIAAKKLLKVFDSFAKEYAPDGVLNTTDPTVIAIARVTPPNNDSVERTFAMVDHLFISVSANMLTANKSTRVKAQLNHTLEWLLKLDPKEAMRITNIANAIGPTLKQKHDQKAAADEKEREALAIEQSRRAEAKAVKRQKLREKHLSIELWARANIDMELEECGSERQQINALSDQLRGIQALQKECAAYPRSGHKVQSYSKEPQTTTH
ncbi:MAG: hypothetical protein ACK5QT_07255 [Oligoflexia bacterium]